jgi:hypothetical protein
MGVREDKGDRDFFTIEQLSAVKIVFAAVGRSARHRLFWLGWDVPRLPRPASAPLWS